MITEELHEYMSYYQHYKNGYLLKSGGVADQPKLYLEIMSLIDSVINGE